MLTQAGYWNHHVHYQPVILNAVPQAGQRRSLAWALQDRPELRTGASSGDWSSCAADVSRRTST